MHGVVMSALQKYVREQEGMDTWRDVKEKAEIDRATYSRTTDYPDEEFLQIYGVLTGEYGMEGDTLQRQFGYYLFGTLVEIYERIYFDDDWDALTMINSVEETIHQSLKQREGTAFTPPELESQRLGTDRIEIIYTSERHLCELAKGMIMGVEDYYDASLEIDETSCLKDGGEVCRLVITDTAS